MKSLSGGNLGKSLLHTEDLKTASQKYLNQSKKSNLSIGSSGIPPFDEAKIRRAIPVRNLRNIHNSSLKPSQEPRDPQSQHESRTFAHLTSTSHTSLGHNRTTLSPNKVHLINERKRAMRDLTQPNNAKTGLYNKPGLSADTRGKVRKRKENVKFRDSKNPIFDKSDLKMTNFWAKAGFKLDKKLHSAPLTPVGSATESL